MLMSILKGLFGQSPFGPLIAHARKVQACVQLVPPLLEAAIREEAEEIHRLQDEVSRLEHEADLIKHEIREHLPRRYFLPVDRSDIDRLLHSLDALADYAQDFAVVLLIRRTRVHPDLVAEFRAFVEQVMQVTGALMGVVVDLDNLAEAAFGGAEAEAVLQRVGGLGAGEWKADRLQRRLGQHIYALETAIDPVTIMFYEKMMHALGHIANAAENAGEILRQMIVKR